MSCLVYYGKAVGICEFEISPEGDITMEAKRTVLANLPAKIDISLSSF
ncbi:hypothetical protein [Emcibacter sp.]